MKILSYVFCSLLLFACTGTKKEKVSDIVVIAKTADTIKHIQGKISKSVKHFIIAPYQMVDDYIVVDTGYLDMTENEGTYAVIEKNGKLIDTIEKGFGFQKIRNDTYLYQIITNTGPTNNGESSGSENKNAISGSLGRYTILSGNKKQILAKLTTNFDDEFSSPRVINGKIYFWQIQAQGSSELNKIFAAEYDPTNKLTKSHYLFDDDIGSDDSGYFPNPYTKNDTIYFDAGKEKILKLSNDFKPYN